MELVDISYNVLSNDVNVKIYLDGVLDKESEKYYNKINELTSQIFNQQGVDVDKILKKTKKLSEKINNVVLFEGKNQDIPREVLHRKWVRSQNIYIENNTVIIPVEEYISIKDIQDSLKTDRDFYEIDFFDRESIVISKDNIYIKSWDPHCSRKYVELPIWKNSYLGEDSNYTYEYKQIKDYESELIELIGTEMLAECKYTKTQFW